MKYLGILLLYFLASCSWINPKKEISSDLKKNIAQTKTIQDQKISLDKLANKIVIVNFWASWCGPCMEETPALLKFVNQNKTDFVLLSISEDDSAKDISKFLNLFPQAKAENVYVIFDQDRTWSQGFSVHRFPETLIYDRKMNLIKKITGAISFTDKVKTNNGEFTAKKVILAMGVRGSPRKLGVLGEDSQKVTYNLIDPEQYQNMDVVVVGGGNAGVEAAQMLGDPKWKNRVHLLVRSQTFDRCNEDNIKRITTMEQKGFVKILYNSSIQEIKPESIIVKQLDQNFELKNSYVFIFAGAEMPHKFLMSLGINIDKKFGDGLAKKTG